jgi:hypothetical protein
VRLLVDPAPLISKIRHLVRVSALIFPSPFEVTSVGKYKKSKSEVRLEILGDFALVISSEFSAFLDLINLNISFGEKVLVLSDLVHVDEVVRSTQLPDFVT